MGDDSARSYDRFTDFFTQADAETDQLAVGTALPAGNTTGSLSIVDRGCTPWDLPAALSLYKVKIMKKTKFFVRSGQTITYQVRDPKRRVMTRYRQDSLEGFNVPRWTKTILMIAKPVPGIALGAGGLTTAKITVGATRKYMYKVEGINETRDLLIKQ